MPTILELFRGSTFDTDVDSKAREGKGTLFSQIKYINIFTYVDENMCIYIYIYIYT